MCDWRLPLVVCTLAISSCGSDDPAPESAGLQELNLAIATRVYLDQRLPAGFYTEPPRDPGAFYTIQHLKSQDVLSTTSNNFEVCSNDLAEALNWSESFNNAQALRGALVETVATDQYFEFHRVLPGNDNRYRLERIFKCSYLIRDGLDLDTGYAGTLTTQPVAASDVQYVAEYLWTFSGYNNVGSIVVESTGANAQDQLSHTLKIARKLDQSGSAGCDYIELINWQYQALLSDGTLNSGEHVVGGFSARQEAGVVQLCD